MENDAVSVFLRVRPTHVWESALSPAANFMDIVNSTDKMIVIEKTPYAFDHIFFSSATQREVFHEMVSQNPNILYQDLIRFLLTSSRLNQIFLDSSKVTTVHCLHTDNLVLERLSLSA